MSLVGLPPPPPPPPPPPGPAQPSPPRLHQFLTNPSPSISPQTDKVFEETEAMAMSTSSQSLPQHRSHLLFSLS
ncbi:hypothetical protein L6452_12795 [Arctium lappa]|uniref:Uncharacterized protein n=1 Tax=Arctium lappa TaxID=4217 RepID=A0ACB9CGD9_ARCLA|nr:hypothetical protein L6452_12795 [Arctium lappa]